MSFYSARVLRAITGKKVPVSAYEVQQSLKKLRGPQEYEVQRFNLEATQSKGVEAFNTRESGKTHWQYVHMRKTSHIKAIKHVVYMYMLLLPVIIDYINRTRFTMESLSKEDPRESAI